MAFLDDMRASKAIGSAIGSKNYDAAIEICKKKLQTDPADSFALSSLAFCYERKGDRETAMEYVNRQLAQYPNDFYMLLIAARYWSEKENDDQTYNYTCRALENAPRGEPDDVPKVAYFIFKVFSIFKKYRKLPHKAKESNLAFKQYYKESIEWAWHYKQWYEEKHASNE